MEQSQAQKQTADAPEASRSRRTGVSAEAAATAQRQSHQPVYIEPRNTSFESEARHAASRFGGQPVDLTPSPFAASGRRAELGPELSRQLVDRLDQGGRPLPGEARQRMERHFHRKLDSVRIHDDPVAAEIGSAIDAHAFALRRHIFFRDGFAASNPQDLRVLAHELMHVLQQSEGASEGYVIQRDDPGDVEVSETWEGEGGDRGFALDFSQSDSLFTMPRLELPKINGKIKGKSRQDGITTTLIPSTDFTYTTRNEERDTAQRQLWTQRITENKTQIEEAIQAFIPNPSSESDSDPIYYLKVRATNQILSGTKAQLLARDELLIPNWNKRGRASFYHVDHYREHQLEGPDSIENVWLLEESANTSSGSRIRNTVLAEINDLFRRAREDNFFQGRNENRDVLRFSRTPRGQRLHFGRVVGGGEIGRNVDTWTVDEIIAAKHIRFGRRRLVQAMSLEELQERGLVAKGDGSPPTTVLWFLGKESGFFRRVDVSDLANPTYSGKPLGAEDDDFFKNFRIQSATLQQGLDPENLEPDQEVGSITGRVRGGVGTYYDRETGQKVSGDRIQVNTEIRLPLRFDRRYGYGAYIDRSGVRSSLMEARAELKGASPLELSEGGLSDAWAMELSATLTATHPMFEGFQATVGLTEYGIGLDVDIPTDRLDFSFFRVTEANLTIAMGDEGLLFGGAAAFELDQIGSGTVVAMGTAIEGTFDFDFDFVDPASTTVRYEDEAWSFDAELGITEGVVPGLQSGVIRVGIDEEGNFLFDGEALVQLPGQPEPATIEIGYSAEEGVSIGGTVTLDTSAWPAVENATVMVNVTYDPETSAWALGGTGSADFAIPGITGTLEATFDDGGLILRGQGDLAIGNATGTFDFAIGNYPVTEEGEFDQSGDPIDSFEAWGGGSISIEFGPYLTGTVGVRYTPEDEIVLAGGIALPPSIPLFDAIERERDLVNFPRVEFPIFGVTIPVVGSIGVFGFIGGRLRGYATIGPATLDDSRADIEYTLGDPDSAVIDGESHLNFGMDAGIELDIGGGLGLGAAVADLTGEVGITAALDFAVDSGADLSLDWTPLAGLSLDLDLHGSFTPSFRVGVYGRVAASVAIYGEVWSERWDETLASFGSGLAVSVLQPASWDEENGLELDFSQAVFTYPDIDVRRIAGDIMERIV
ncbi:DUF4157 domain-containing protein [Halomonas stenophila]|uniref:eCIS core domain-containing protein n=1 Tax=Halomonas stenophila TaxID=795312 RepID=A0A7W5EX17_9GAMM|nr:DUF4157 domain-containing protein [Halomonas stenophila]MBB3232261.1 hypothetical protein [Halomonas stenophila]